MRQHGIRARRPRRYRVCTTDSKHCLPVADFVAHRPDRVWLADITYIPTGEGWLYLAVILDLSTRKVVGWAMREHMRAELTIVALIMAIQRRLRPVIATSPSKCCDDHLSPGNTPPASIATSRRLPPSPNR